MELQPGLIVTTLQGDIILLTDISVPTGILQNALVQHRGVLFSSSQDGYKDAGKIWRAPDSVVLKVVGPVGMMVSRLEELGIDFSAAEKPLTELELLKKRNEELERRLAVIESGVTQTITSDGLH